jgi:hypothetical protein
MGTLCMTFDSMLSNNNTVREEAEDSLKQVTTNIKAYKVNSIDLNS